MIMFFLKLLNMSIAAGWLILAVIVMRQFLRKAPRWLCCVLWAIVAVRLICPFSPESPFSLIPSVETISPAAVQYTRGLVNYSERDSEANSGIFVMDNVLDSETNSVIPAMGNTPNLGVSSGTLAFDSTLNPVIDSGSPDINNILNPMISESFAPAPGDSVNPLYVWTFVGSIIWIIGLTVMLGYACFSFIGLRRKVREAVRLRDNIWLCDTVKSPFILGVIRPKIYLPSDIGVSSGIDEEQIKYILAHEEAHLQRRDHWWKALGYLLLAVYWFQPLVWAAYILLCRDIELACDEKAIRDMDIEGKKSYSNALVTCSMQRRMVTACPLAFGEIGVKERVRTVLHYRKPAFWAVAVAICVCAAVALCFLTNPRRDTFDVKIVIPANSEQTFYYSDEEMSPYRDRVILSSGEGLGDTEVVLKPMEGITREDAYDDLRAYMTPGLSVKMYAEKGGWFKVGVLVGNPTDKDIVVYVRVKGVTVRIADYIAKEGGTSDPSAGGENAGGDSGPSADGENAGASSGPGVDGENAGGTFGMGASGENAGVSSNSGAEGETVSTITFFGVIKPHILNSSSTKPIIMVEPIGDEISYESVCFVLPVEEADWASRVNSMVSITCRDVFEESDPPFGKLISIGAVSTTPNMKEPITGVNALPHLQGSALEAVTAAILEDNAQSWPEKYDFECCDFVLLETLFGCPLPDSTTHIITYYGWELYEKYNISDKGIEDLGGSHIPVALTFTLDENGYELKEYWKPGDGSYYVSDIRNKFPAHIAEDGIDGQKFIYDQVQSCYKQAILASGLDTDAVIDSLLDTICSDPRTSSNPQDYINTHFNEYKHLLFYGEYTLRYCFTRFEQGNETGLEGRIMAMVCEEILQTKGAIPADAGTAETGQFWYDTLYAHGSNNVEPYQE